MFCKQKRGFPPKTIKQNEANKFCFSVRIAATENVELHNNTPNNNVPDFNA